MTQPGGGRTGWARADPVRVGVSLPARAVGGGVSTLPSRTVGSSLAAPARTRPAPSSSSSTVSSSSSASPEEELEQLRSEFRRRLGSDSEDEFEAFVSKTQQRFQQMFAEGGLQGMQGVRLGGEEPFRGLGGRPTDAGGTTLALGKARPGAAAARDPRQTQPALKDSGPALRLGGGSSLFDKHAAMMESPPSLLDGQSSLLNGKSLLDGHSSLLGGQSLLGGKSLLGGDSMLSGKSLLGGQSLLSSGRLGRSAEDGGLSGALATRTAGGPLVSSSRLPAGVQQTFQSSSTSTTVTSSSGGRGQPNVTRVMRQQQQEHTHSDGAAVRQQRAQSTEAATVTERGGRAHVDASRQQLQHNRAVRLDSAGGARVTEEVAASGGTRRGVFEAGSDGPRQVAMSGTDYNVRAQLGMKQALAPGGGGDGQMVPMQGVSGPLWRFFDAGPLIQPPGMRLKYKINVQASQSSFTCRDGELPKITGNQIAFEDSYGSESESDDDDDFTPALAAGARPSALGWSGRPALGDSPRTGRPALGDSPSSDQRRIGWSNKPALPWRAGSAEPLPRLEITELPPEDDAPTSDGSAPRRHRPLCRTGGQRDSPPRAGTAPGVAALPWRSAARPPSLAPSEAPSVDSEGDVEPGDVTSEQVERQRRERLRKIATELLTTERKYVQELHLIDQIFRRRVEEENRVQHMFNNDVSTQMFSNIQSIHQFHRDHLLPELEARLSDWDNNPRIGDIMKRSAPFLKMYTEYVSGYSNAMNLINTYQQKCPRFAAIMDHIHEMEECVNLPLQHHVIVPVQRVPRYELLLKDYLAKLAADSPDRADAQRALELVTLAARHSNDTMKRVDKFKQLLEIQEYISGGPDLVSPTRELLKEGKICKISARSGDHQERYLFLFSDLLLLCSARLINKRIISGPAFRLRAKFSVEGLQVLEGDNLETLNTFYISGSNKNVELYTQTAEEKAEWLEALSRVVSEFYERRSSLKGPDADPECARLGQTAPRLASADSATRCAVCVSPFSVMRRKHNCRACGEVVCSKCSNNKSPLACEGGRPSRVCDLCHRQLAAQRTDSSAPSGRRESVLDATYRRGKGALHVAASEPSQLCGELQLRCRRAWVRRWFCLRSNCVLFMYSSADAVTALAASPVPGFTVTWAGAGKVDLGVAEKEKDKAFRLALGKRSYTFLTDNKDDLARWIAALQKASRVEALPAA